MHGYQNVCAVACRPNVVARVTHYSQKTTVFGVVEKIYMYMHTCTFTLLRTSDKILRYYCPSEFELLHNAGD